MKPLAFFALLAVLVALGLGSVHAAQEPPAVDYYIADLQEQIDVLRSRVEQLEGGAVDQGLDSLEVEAKYGSN